MEKTRTVPETWPAALKLAVGAQANVPDRGLVGLDGHVDRLHGPILF